jgi:biopolymer transport protein ExbD
MAGGGGCMDSGEPEFQIAPMIDVLLVMLIFFMTITSAQVLRVDKNIKLPIGPNAQRKENGRAEAIVNIRWEGQGEPRKAVFSFLDKLYADPEEFMSELRAAREISASSSNREQASNFRVVIRADRDVPALHVSRVMNVAGQAGVADISFSTVNRD